MLHLVAAVILIFAISANVRANPFLPKSSESPISARVGTCSITGGFIHLYSALWGRRP
ncbi:MAG: hypothetical protein ACREQ2_15000 [Candidatus Binatia bacterium]